MTLLTKDQHEQLIANGIAQRASGGRCDPYPVVKLIMPGTDATWLLCELEPDDHDIAFGLCDLGMGFPELGCVRLSELESVRGLLGISVERVESWRAMGPISAYLDAAFKAGSIVDLDEGAG